MRDTFPPADNPTSRADFYAAAVYGSVVAASLIGAFREEGTSSEAITLALLSTLFVFWAAHVWSAIVGERIALGMRFTFRHALEIARAEWPLIEAAFAPAAMLLLGWVGAITDHAAATAALVVCVLQLFGWGLLVGRRAYDNVWIVLITGAANALLGVALISLEIVVVH